MYILQGGFSWVWYGLTFHCLYYINPEATKLQSKPKPSKIIFLFLIHHTRITNHNILHIEIFLEKFAYQCFLVVQRMTAINTTRPAGIMHTTRLRTSEKYKKRKQNRITLSSTLMENCLWFTKSKIKQAIKS